MADGIDTNPPALDPKAVAANMVAIRGHEQAIERCDRYISGAIRSEEPKSFWAEVKSAITEAG